MNKQFLESLLFIAKQEKTMEAGCLVNILSILYDIQHYNNNVIEVSYKILSELKSYGELRYDHGYAEGCEDSETEYIDN